MHASNYLEKQILNHFLRKQNIPSPENLYLALYISDPTDYNIGTEVSGGSYERIPISFSEPTQGDGMALIYNDTDIRFPIATDRWGIPSHYGVCDAKEGGELLVHGVIRNPREFLQDDEFSFPVGFITFKLD